MILVGCFRTWMRALLRLVRRGGRVRRLCKRRGKERGGGGGER